ncbi:hypothetical protein P7266_1088 [Lactococcus cremoris]|nr:hypothetical protein P7266_1088 [Lactococcus cremoris]
MIVDFGNVWDALTAIGTMGAVIISLYLTRKDYKKKLRIDYWVSYKILSGEKFPIWCIDVTNTGVIPVKIYEIGVYQRSNFFKRRRSIPFLVPRDLEQESSKLPVLIQPQEDATYFVAQEEWAETLQDFTYSANQVAFYVIDTTGKLYKTKYFKVHS